MYGLADRSLLQPLHQQHRCKAHTCAQHTPSPQHACPVSTPCCGPPSEPCHALPAWCMQASLKLEAAASCVEEQLKSREAAEAENAAIAARVAEEEAAVSGKGRGG